MYEDLVKRLRAQADAERYFVGEDMLYDKATDAIEELQQTVEHYKGCADDWYKEACDYKAMLTRWIPVTERLPENGEYVLAYSADDDYMTVEARHKFGAFQITHWMPLPEPPKEEI